VPNSHACALHPIFYSGNSFRDNDLRYASLQTTAGNIAKFKEKGKTGRTSSPSLGHELSNTRIESFRCSTPATAGLGRRRGGRREGGIGGGGGEAPKMIFLVHLEGICQTPCHSRR
jgi:hypothetical protein